MTTNITALAQSLKAAANTTADAIDRLKAFPGDELIDLSQHEGEQVDIDIATLNQWYELSSPANVLALVEALEKAQQRIVELDRKNCELDSLTQRWAVERAENADRIAELESRAVKLPQRHSMLLREDFSEDYHTEMAYKADEVQASLAAVGIKVEAE
ncbi:TPA: ead/Ea22-like family protein [Klebsiella pneumoniae]|nr:ead/Ea22-like family protein [Klebsiella pneumoniae]